MKPTKKTEFKSITELKSFSDKDQYFCDAVVFSPETENDHFHGCPPYISVRKIKDSEQVVFFEIPEIVAYYAKTHPCYTMQGKRNDIKTGERNMAKKIRDLLEL